MCEYCLLLCFLIFVVILIIVLTSNIFHKFQSDSDVVSSICGALESIHAALAIMAYNDMPKQLYNEEVHAADQLLCYI